MDNSEATYLTNVLELNRPMLEIYVLILLKG